MGNNILYNYPTEGDLMVDKKEFIIKASELTDITQKTARFMVDEIGKKYPEDLEKQVVSCLALIKLLERAFLKEASANKTFFSQVEFINGEN